MSQETYNAWQALQDWKAKGNQQQPKTQQPKKTNKNPRQEQNKSPKNTNKPNNKEQGKPQKTAQAVQAKKSASQKNVLTLSRDVKIECFPVFGTMEVMQHRPDIAALLNTDIHALPERLKAYLQKISLLDNTLQLTPKGEAFLRNNLLPTQEKGLYRIWYAQQDQLLENRPLAIQRIDAFAKREAIDHQIRYHKVHDAQRLAALCHKESINAKLFNLDKKELDNIQLRFTELELLCEPVSTCNIQLTWALNGDGAKVSISGLIPIEHISKQGKGGTENYNRELDTDFDTDSKQNCQVFDSLAWAMQGSWDNKQRRLELPYLDIIDNYQTLNSCSLTKLPYQQLLVQQWGKFNITHFDRLDITPLPEATLDWQKGWQQYYYIQGSVTPITADKKQQNWRSQRLLRHHDIAPMGQHEVLSILEESGRKRAYWNAAAGMDLVPSLPQEKGLPLSLADGEVCDMHKLVSHLTGGCSIEKIIISDRYYRSNYQSDLLHQLANIAQCQEGLFFCCKEEFHQQLPLNWQSTFFSKKIPENHDRYWLLFTPAGIRAWKVSCGLDFARRQSDGLWQINGHPSFFPIEEADLPQYLRHQIELRQQELNQ